MHMYVQLVSVYVQPVCICTTCQCIYIHQVVQDVQYVCEPQHEQTVE